MVDNIKEKNNELYPEPVTLKATEKIIEQMNNAICRIYNKNKNGNGFFLKIPFRNNILLPVLITNYHIIDNEYILNKKNISIYLNNHKKITTLKLDNNRKIYTNEKNDITIIEIKEKEDKLNNKYLELDDNIINHLKLNSNEELYCLNNIYSNESIYMLNYPEDNNITVSYGKILYLNNTKLFYQCNINKNSFGSPILLANNQKLIGIFNSNSTKYKYNKGDLLIYSLIEFSKNINKSLLINKESDLINNYIIGIFDIKEDNQSIRIISSYEQYCREYKFDKYEKEYENEKEIKDYCEIKINDELIPFSYFHTFNKKGIYKIKYTFLLNITKIDYMFYGCSSLAHLDLSNFNTNIVTNMSYIFRGCSSLTSINVSNINTNNVTDMSCMFSWCSSLITLNLSNFNTDNVTNMSWMFSGYSSLISIDLSNFNTNNVKDMSCIFYGCVKLTKNNIITNNKKILEKK